MRNIVGFLRSNSVVICKNRTKNSITMK
uniref:Uncharacterized protein n=1 Tax=Arundo donax TaxID=35708 RepID=A0A0A9EB51_ARUDO